MLSKSFIVFAISGIIAYFFFFRGGGGDPLPKNIQSESPRLIKEQAIIGIDVRSPGELQSNPAPGSLHIPMGVVEDKIKELDKSKHYVVFCESGMRASIVVKQMKDLGFQKVSNIKDWRSWNKMKN